MLCDRSTSNEEKTFGLIRTVAVSGIGRSGAEQSMAESQMALYIVHYL